MVCITRPSIGVNCVLSPRFLVALPPTKTHYKWLWESTRKRPDSAAPLTCHACAHASPMPSRLAMACRHRLHSRPAPLPRILPGTWPRHRRVLPLGPRRALLTSSSGLIARRGAVTLSHPTLLAGGIRIAYSDLATPQDAMRRVPCPPPRSALRQPLTPNARAPP